MRESTSTIHRTPSKAAGTMLRQSMLKGNRKGGDPRLSTATKSDMKRIKSTEKLSDLNAP